MATILASYNQPQINRIALGIEPSNPAVNADEVDVLKQSLLKLSLASMVQQIQVLDLVLNDVLAYRIGIMDGKKSKDLPIRAETEILLQLQERLAAKAIAAEVVDGGDESLIAEDLLSSINEQLHLAIALRDELFFLGKDITAIDSATLAERYNKRVTACLYLDDKIVAYLKERVSKVENPDEIWTPLDELKNKNQEQMLGYIIKAIPVDETVNDHLNTFIFTLLRAAHIELDLPLIAKDPASLFVSGNSLLKVVEAQDCREAIGASFAPYFKKLVDLAGVESFDPLFRTAYFGAVSFLQRYYAQHPIVPEKPYVQVATEPASSPIKSTSIPVVATPQPMPAQQQPATPPTLPTAPTIDFRHQEESAITPSTDVAPPTNPQPEEPKIKPINLQ